MIDANEVNFDDVAEQMIALKAAIFNSQESNEAKIRFLKEELAAERYQVDSHRIAEKLVSHFVFRTEEELA